jgi:hypothetical protein
MSSQGVDLHPEAVNERMQAVVQMFQDGCSAPYIAQQLGMSERSVWYLKRKAGLTKPSPKITDEQVTQMGQMLDDGMSYTEISRTMGIDWAAIRRRFPGRQFTQAQAAEARNLRRKLDRIESRVIPTEGKKHDW